MRVLHWRHRSSAAFALAGVLPPFCGQPGVPPEPPLPDQVLGCEALPWSNESSFQVLEGEPARALGVSANGAVVVGAIAGRAAVWDPDAWLLPSTEAFTTPAVNVANCAGDVFAGADARVVGQPDVVRGFRQTRTGAPVLLALTTQHWYDLLGMRVQSFSADGALLLGYVDNGLGNWPYSAIWDATGAIREPFGNRPRMALVLSPDGTHIGGRTDCEGGMGCTGLAMFDWSEAEGQTNFAPMGLPLAIYERAIMSHDRTTAASAPQDTFPYPTLTSVTWFRKSGETIEFPCAAAPCRAVAMSSHGSVVLLDDGSVWTQARGLRSFAQFLADAGVVLPSDALESKLLPRAISDDARVMVGSFTNGSSERAFRVTVSPAAYL